MLSFFRKKTKIIIWSVLVAFIAWGGYAVSLQLGESNRSPGKIFGKEVSFREYSLANRVIQNLSPPPEGENLPTSQEVEARTWEFLMLSREAIRQKTGVRDEEVRQEIDRLLGQNEFPITSNDQYMRWVRANFHEEPREFENQLREQIRIRKLLGEVRKRLPENSEEGLRQWLLELSKSAKITVYAPSSQSR